MGDIGRDTVAADSFEDQSRPAQEPDFILPGWMRRACFYAGILVAYCQFTALSFASFFRYLYPYQENPDEYIGGYVAWGLPSPEAFVRVMPDLSVTSSIVFVLEGAIVALLGSAGLFCISYARRTSRMSRWKLIIISIVGGTMPIVMSLFEIHRYLQRWNEFRYVSLHLSESYPMHGVFEYIGGIALPFILYPILILWLIFKAGKPAQRRVEASG